jgi:hypothetical protein
MAPRPQDRGAIVACLSFKGRAAVRSGMPTLLRLGEGCTSGEVIDERTRSIRRGNGHGTLEW